MISITHAKVSTIADDPDAATAGEILPSDWNDDHSITGLGTAAEADTADFATAAQGALAASAVQPADLATVAFTGDYADLTGSPTPGAVVGGYGVTVTSPQNYDLLQFNSASNQWVNSPLLDGGNF